MADTQSEGYRLSSQAGPVNILYEVDAENLKQPLVRPASQSVTTSSSPYGEPPPAPPPPPVFPQSDPSIRSASNYPSPPTSPGSGFVTPASQQLYQQPQAQQYQFQQTGGGAPPAGYGADEQRRASIQSQQSRWNGDGAPKWGGPPITHELNRENTLAGVPEHDPSVTAYQSYATADGHQPYFGEGQMQYQQPGQYIQPPIPGAAEMDGRPGGAPSLGGGEEEKPKKICGMQKSVFILVLVLIVIVAVGAIVGGVLGGIVYKDKGKGNNSSQQDKSTISIPPTPTVTTTTTTRTTSTSTGTPTTTIPSYLYPLPTGTWMLTTKRRDDLVSGNCILDPFSNYTGVWFCEVQEVYSFTITDVSNTVTDPYAFELSGTTPVPFKNIPGTPPTGTDVDKNQNPYWSFKVYYNTTAQQNCRIDVDMLLLLGRTKSVYGIYENAYSRSVCNLSNGKTAPANTNCGCGYLP